MATVMQPPEALPAPTCPRLQAINQNFSDLDEQIRQAAYIIGLPDDWDAIEVDAQSRTIQRMVKARADWVLRWILEKLKDSADTGTQARASAQAWKLVDWMIHALPISRCAQHLRDADFVTILEKTLESLGTDASTQPMPVPQDSSHRGASESSETVHEEPQPSRKRKRGSSGTSTPSKKAAVESGFAELFGTVTTVIRSIRDKASSKGTSDEIVQVEHMSMVLKTECAQAARILKYWLNVVQRMAGPSPKANLTRTKHSLDLPLVVDIWELRTIDAKDDSGASSEQFSAECLLPALTLSQTLQRGEYTNEGQEETSEAARQAVLTLNKLLAKHVLLPSRAAFFQDRATDTAEGALPKLTAAKSLASNLVTLRARIIQAAQIEDAGQPVPADLMAAYSAVPQLLDLVVRSSPARTSKSRTTEKPWIQAAFVALMDCAGCSLEVPEFVTPKASITALQDSLKILASHDVIVDSKILKDLFWFHSGLKYPLKQERKIHWSLIAVLAEIDSGIFLPDPRSAATDLNGRSADLTEFLFYKISTWQMEQSTLEGEKTAVDCPRSQRTSAQAAGEDFGREAILNRVVVPIMSAFARNRNLLGFLKRWDAELCKGFVLRLPSLWEDRSLTLALAGLFEQTLTQGQIVALFDQHTERLRPQRKHTGSTLSKQVTPEALEPSPEAYSSTVIMQAMLESISADETVEALKPQLLSLLASFTLRVQPDNRNATSGLAAVWMTLCQLVVLLWPIHLHGSLAFQKELLYPLLEQASQDIATSRKERVDGADSPCRAAAMAFLFTACDCLRTLPDTGDLIRKRLRKALKSFTPRHWDMEELTKMADIFCAEHTRLLECFDQDTCRAIISGLLSTISTFDKNSAEQIAQAFSQAIFTRGSPSLQATYTNALLDAIAQESESLQTLAVQALIQTTPTSMARELRETVIDKITGILASRLEDVPALLSIMTHLMEIPNATAQISSNSDALFDLAQTIHDSQLESPSMLQSLQNLVRLTLSHVVLYKKQKQNSHFLEKYGSKVVSILKKPQKCFPASVAVLRGTVLARQQENNLLPIDQYVALLSACLQEKYTPEEFTLDAFNEIPRPAFHGAEAAFSAAQATLRSWVTAEASSGLVSLSSKTSLSQFPPQFWPRIHTTVARYQLLTNEEADKFVTLSLKVLRQPLTAQEKGTALISVREAFSRLSVSEKLALVPLCTPNEDDGNGLNSYHILGVFVSSLGDKQEVDAELQELQYALLSKVCTLLGNCGDYASFNTLLDSVNTFIQDRPSLTTQHTIECVLTVLVKLTSRNAPRLTPDHAPALYARLCETSRLILLLHRGRLRGRFHLLMPLLQGLLFCLFVPSAGRGAALPPWLESSSSKPARLTTANASQYTRLLSTLCSPTLSSVQRAGHHSHVQGSKTSLNDPVKVAREYASQYVYPLLSSFCRFQLNGRLEPQVREKLMPGIWEVVGLGSLDRQGLDAMFAGLDRSTRDVWRGVWGEWQRVHGRKDREGA